MNITSAIGELSSILASDATVTYAMFAALAYSLIVVGMIGINLIFETTTFLRLQLIVMSKVPGTTKVLSLNKLLRAQMPLPKDTQKGDEAPLEPSHLAQRILFFVSSAHRTRVGRSTGALLRAYAAHGAGTHQKAGILPSEDFLNDHDPGPSTNANRWFDTLIRISLLVTFAGIAAVLFSTGQAVDQLGGGEAATTADNSEIIGEISKVIGAAATKFFSTVFALLFGTSFLVISYAAGKVIKVLLYLTSVRMDALLSEADVEDAFAADAESVITGDMREKSRMIRSLGDIGEQMRKIGSSFDNQLVAGMRAMQADQAKRLDDFITQLGALLDGLYKSGIALPVQSAISEPVQQNMAELTRLLGGIAVVIKEQEERSAESINALVDIFQREQVATRDHAMKQLREQIELNRTQTADLIERQVDASKRQSDEVTALLKSLEAMLRNDRRSRGNKAAPKTTNGDPSSGNEPVKLSAQ